MIASKINTHHYSTTMSCTPLYSDTDLVTFSVVVFTIVLSAGIFIELNGLLAMLKRPRTLY